MTEITAAGNGRASHFPVALARIDAKLDAVFEPWRGQAVPDIAAAAISTISDHGLIWMGIAAYQGRRPGPARSRAIGGLALAGCSSFVVNRAVKHAVGRARPDAVPTSAAGGLPVRAPSSSSFPSGHTLAATCAALTLGVDATDTVALGAMALAVAASRVHLRHHHPSDVLGGLLIGAALACLTRPLAGAISRRRRPWTAPLGIRSRARRLKRAWNFRRSP